MTIEEDCTTATSPAHGLGTRTGLPDARRCTGGAQAPSGRSLVPPGNRDTLSSADCLPHCPPQRGMLGYCLERTSRMNHPRHSRPCLKFRAGFPACGTVGTFVTPVPVTTQARIPI